MGQVQRKNCRGWKMFSVREVLLQMIEEDENLEHLSQEHNETQPEILAEH